MNTEHNLTGLYQEIIVEHSKRPRFKGSQAGCRFCQEGKNPLCGDEVKIFVNLKTGPDTTVPRLFASFEGRGCSISQASASMMCAAIQNVTPTQAREEIKKAEDIYSGKTIPADAEDFEEDIEALSGVSQFPMRVKCAALPWKSLEMLLDDNFDSSGNVVNKGPVDPGQCVESCRKKLKVVSLEA